MRPITFVNTPDYVPAAIAVESRATDLANRLLTSARAQQSTAERREAAQMTRLMHDAPGKAFTFAMVDQTFRSGRSTVRANRLRTLLGEYGVPQYLPAFDRLLMRAGAVASRVLPGVVMKGVEQRMRKDCARVILPGESGALHRYLHQRQEAGFRINLNHLGEAVMSEAEAERRMKAVLEHLADPAVNYISVKISAMFSQINLTAWQETLTEIKTRLRRLYRAAAAGGKFVNLDMEEYRDLALTISAFREVLDEQEFKALSAGIVLQAYLPDSWPAQQTLTDWARRRVERGGAPVKIRLVKGANLAMEAVEAELHGWNSAPYVTKPDTDANFRRMLEYGCLTKNATAVKLGVASHNLFDVALALTLREEYGTTAQVEIEMLEGMANHQARAVRSAAGGLLLYAPAVQRHDFLSAMAYLVRRLDENTAAGNFLRDMFSMQPGSTEWEAQRSAFVAGWQRRQLVSTNSRRAQPLEKGDGFHNEPDSDWTQAKSREALSFAIATHQCSPLPSLPSLDLLTETARNGHAMWGATGIEYRAAILNTAAEVMAAQRFTTLAMLRSEGKKAVTDGDAEVSEAIDFARYYAIPAAVPAEVKATPAGITVIAPPWNFPYAIPCGGVLAALMAGNAVILKPAPEVQQCALLLAQQLWQAGIPRDVLQCYPCTDGETGRALMYHPDVACVVLTGAWETARLFQSWRPSLRLLAETSGKNALIITAQADRELAIKDLVRSAFGHSGQKCSAASLAIIEAEVYDDPAFRRQLREAASSMPVGPAGDPCSVVTPLIREPHENLRRALTTLEPGEEWLLEPRDSPDDPCLWSPGIRMGVRPGSWFHQTECFGPVLGLMRAESLEQAIAWQNATRFGLTAGLHSLDSREISTWRDRVEAGNLYVNRLITGAVVQRQPFGGWKRSCIGPGAKAGGPNYVWSFLNFTDALPADAEASYLEAWRNHFSVEHDPSALRCESNTFRYRPARGVVLRLETEDAETVRRAKLASAITGTSLTISHVAEENDEVFATRLSKMAESSEFLRITGTCSETVLRAAHDAGLNVIATPLTACGRVELRHWLREQSVTRTLHRYGQITNP